MANANTASDVFVQCVFILLIKNHFWFWLIEAQCLTCFVIILLLFFLYREALSNQDKKGDAALQKSTGALISDKDRELETLRSEVLPPECHLSVFFLSQVWKIFSAFRRLPCCAERTPWPRRCSRLWRRWRRTKLSCRVEFAL